MRSDAFPIFEERAPWWGPDLQTVRNILLPKPKELDGGARLLLAMPDGDRLAARLDRPAEPGGRPLVVLIHGLTGTEASVNVVRTARHLVSGGWPVLRLNLRGSALSRPTSKGRYHAGKTEDLAAALRQLPDELVRRGVALVGHSLGGNLVLKFMGEGGHDALVLGAVAVSTPLDLAAASQRIEAPRNLIYHHYLLAGLKSEALAPGAELTSAQRSAIASARSIYEFDDRFVAPCFGFRDAADYYERNSAVGFLRGVDRPALVIHAMDDPWIPAAVYEGIDWPSLKTVETAVAPGGGHLGFHGRGSPIGWHDLVTAAWLACKFT
ncbi:YheT family hydrolase [Methylocystis parvus]|uniref:Alpha/beta fold hydrolase n=1 Tax=Methylocystis parvus TaxID=134 RepID=A0A6B8M2D6_9HYPH|nr:alpha/beta fold hydrolase [Methylocystis parvus]QGM97021.1 alpha/beta fold hydrolase [Methylocystis parvus]WBJ99084.1 alpha/beta fold hydrolase [Methylocystis parvus OBBP]